MYLQGNQWVVESTKMSWLLWRAFLVATLLRSSTVSTSHPHCNPMKTPCFLDGRDQYTYAQTIGSRDLCQGRYGSEAYNKRTNDHVYLQDKVPRCRFENFEHVLQWSMFKANMCQPFLMPRNACQKRVLEYLLTTGISRRSLGLDV